MRRNHLAAWIGAVAVALSVASAVDGITAAGLQNAPAPLAAATPDIEAFIRDAIADRLSAGNLPDQGLLERATRIAIREELPIARLTLGAAALPRLAGREFYLIGEAAAQRQADSTRQPLPFIAVDRPAVNGDTASVSLGVDIALPADPSRVKLCCCSGDAQFSRVSGRWAFVRWQQMVCV